MLIKNGNPGLMGCNVTLTGINFSYVSEAEEITLLLYVLGQAKPKHRIKLNSTYKTGDVFSCCLSADKTEELDALKKMYYCYEIDKNSYVDPYAKAISNCESFGVKTDTDLYLSPIVIPEFDWEGDRPLNLDYSDMIMYKLNVRGFTKSKTSGVKNKGTFAGIMEKADYLKELGVTTLELMPAYEFDEVNRFEQLREDTIMAKFSATFYNSDPTAQPVNYWGYTKGFYYSPKSSFCSKKAHSGEGLYTVEFKQMVKKLHSIGIEVVMEMFFDSVSSTMIIDCCEYWVKEYHIDGIHLYADEAVLKCVVGSPLLSNTKIITTYWDGPMGKVKHVGNYNIDFQNTVRRFLKGDENQLRGIVDLSLKNPVNSGQINFVTNNNGFTLNDLVSFDRKHNELNGENNRDGENFNYSWNCGEEGATKKKRVKELRIKQVKNAFTMLLMSQGTPLILAGDEFLNSQNGNNNPYCLDSEVSWVNWKNTVVSNEIYTFVKELIAFRKKYSVLHMKYAPLMTDRLSCGYPDVSTHGSSAWFNNMEPYDRHVGVMYASMYQDTPGEELIYVAYNMHWESHELALPKIAEKGGWNIVFKTCSDNENVSQDEDKRTVLVAPRSICILTGKREPKKDEPRKSKRNRK